MRVAELWWYPVKSVPGLRRATSPVGPHGLAGDRQWALLDLDTGVVLTARRVPELLLTRVEADPDGGPPVLVLPDGTRTAAATADAVLSAWLDRSVRLVQADDTPGTYEIAADFEDEAAGPWLAWQGPPGSFHDSTRTLVSLVSRTTIDAAGPWDVRRFRPNVVLDAGDEDALVGHRVQLGTAVLDIVKQIDRCVITTRPQRDGVARDLDVLRTINRERGGFLAVGALVVTPGDAAEGDELVDLGPRPGS